MGDCCPGFRVTRFALQQYNVTSDLQQSNVLLGVLWIVLILLLLLFLTAETGTEKTDELS